MNYFTIERLKSRDAKAASAFAKRVIASLAIYNSRARSDFAKEVEARALAQAIRRGTAIFVAKKEEKVVGFANYSPSESGVGWIDWLLVDSAHRQKGVGTLLIMRVLAFAKKHGEHAVWADTRTSNSRSIRLVRKLGFRKIGVFEKAWYKQDFYLWYRHV